MVQAERPITPDEIRQRAYELWERTHRPEGLEIEFWLLAQRELRAERQASQATASDGMDSKDQE